jgi:hypothetical protein
VAWGEEGDATCISSVVEYMRCWFYANTPEHKTADAYAGYVASRCGGVFGIELVDTAPPVTWPNANFFFPMIL